MLRSSTTSNYDADGLGTVTSLSNAAGALAQTYTFDSFGKLAAIELYPIRGCVCFRQPWSRYDDALIAWGGVAVQAVVAVPLVTFVTIFGLTRSDAVNVAIGVLGYYSLIVAVFNLIPVRPLDGAKASYLIPELIKRARISRTKPKRMVGWRGW